VSVLEVGQPYVAGRTAWREGAEYSFRRGEHELRIFLPSASPAEIEAVRAGEAEFALVVELPVIFLMYRFGSLFRWSDSTFSWPPVPAAPRALLAPEGSETRALLRIALVNAESGLVLALRTITLSPLFTHRLYGAIREQARMAGVGRKTYDLILADVHRRYPIATDLLKRAVARTMGGA